MPELTMFIHKSIEIKFTHSNIHTNQHSYQNSEKKTITHGTKVTQNHGLFSIFQRFEKKISTMHSIQSIPVHGK